ncbi:F1F0 ATPase subunit 2 [Aminivibrio pyruvatiphilus]|uniref:F1F0 ATPase subunit 2 n=1 Tax=Aminivibrio pyruvatiphilus TaxID=1005740 RepID=A0A4R8MFU7_9BACT|nr:ATP synthase subunit I [Aminivibrio pyruvatiphilus]TDY63252.1 F1F0 ATPase subunit 2 [Aminivibrio pyruvatiphilus]
MTGTDVLMLILVFAAGVLLGVVFFGGLRWTVLRGIGSPRPALWFFGSFLVRMVFLLTALFCLSGGAWIRLLLLGAGILLARSLVLRWTRSPGKESLPEQEVLHAPQP